MAPVNAEQLSIPVIHEGRQASRNDAVAVDDRVHRMDDVLPRDQVDASSSQRLQRVPLSSLHPE
jgi:hypothetical protein